MKLVDDAGTLPPGAAAPPPAPAGDGSPIGPPPGDPSTFTYHGLATRAHHRAEFPLSARGKSAVYMFRWVSTRGEKGPWSEVASATVAA
ncbi:MAG: hypothetical protein DYG94_01980 [Leptolyngbya sp. PLA3]|nr:MAG: hypothetical protein EDM82_02575 [Cyanobacteria bacterium CYA]MCE7967501.1 hypothetical protein [Leptolyngbya sp. PL-A3]